MGSTGIKQTALTASGNANTQAQNAYNVTNPIYQKEATSPQGFTGQQMADQLTASAQNLGGGQASAVGQGNLLAARTNNAGGAAAAIDDSARSAMAQQSQNALGVQNQSAMLARQQQQQGLAGLNGIYDTGTSTGLGYMNTANSAAQADQATKLGYAKLGVQVAGAAMGACWIAAELFGGWDDTRTHIVRRWIFGKFSESPFGSMMASLYLRFGERIAERIRTDRVLRWVMSKIFNSALRRASK